MNQVLIVIIRFYQLCLSPFFPRRCRFYPTCSSYALESLKRFSFFTSLWYILRRLLRCHPWHSGGYDAV
ncbi:MAG: membrane protein insertion efficiency factor YidD, partial [Halobacteriovoraceae bacterium]|nr:membrane protein insertion efficiency factor YidD [Halobacteriovoraceae bacterium]